MRCNYPVIVLNSPSTPSSTRSTEDTYSNKVYTTTVVEEYVSYNYDVDNQCGHNDRVDECDVINIRRAHSKDSVISVCDNYG